MRKITSLILVTALAISCLSGCSTKAEVSESSDVLDFGSIQTGPYYTYSAVRLSRDTANGTDYGFSWGENIIATVNVTFSYDAEYNYFVDECAILVYDYDGNLVSNIPVPDACGSYVWKPILTVDSSDNIHLVIVKPGDGDSSENRYCYYEYSSTGELINSADIDLDVADMIRAMTYTESDGLIILADSMNGYNYVTNVTYYAPNGTITNTIEISDLYVNDDFFIYQDEVYLLINDFSSNTTYLARPSDVAIGNIDSYFTIPNITSDDAKYFADSRGLIYRNGEDGTYSLINPVDGTATLIADISDIDTGVYPTYVAMNDDYEILFIGSNGLDTTNYLATVSSSDTDVNANKTVINVAGIGISNDPIANYMKFSFNTTHPDYRIVFTDYYDVYGYEYEMDELSMLIAEDLMYQRLSGDSPDIIFDMSGRFPFYTISNSNCLVDLNGYYSEDIAGENVFEDIIDNSMVDNSLYAIPLAYSISGFVTYADNYANAGDWSFDGFASVADGYDGQMIPNISSEVLLTYHLQTSFVDYFDIANMSVNFESEEFISLLNWAKDNGDYIMDMPSPPYYYMFQDGMHYCEYMELYIDSLFRTATLAETDVDVLGFPSMDGSYLGAFPQYRLAITADADNPEVAWDFIACGFEESAQNTLGRLYFPVSIDAFEYGVDYNYTNNSVGARFDVDTAESMVYDLVSRVNRVSQYDPEIFAVVVEESQAFFNDAKSAEDVADIIQDRCETVMSERYG